MTNHWTAKPAIKVDRDGWGERRIIIIIIIIIIVIIIIIIDNFCIALFSGVHKLAVLYNILQHFLSFTNIIHIIMTANNV